MLPILLAAGAFAAVSLQPPNQNPSDSTNQESEEDIENFFLGRNRDRTLLPGKTLIAENSRIIRPTLNGVQNPEDAAKAWEEYHRKYENVAHTLSNANHAGGENARYFRGDINKRQRRPHLPDRESFSEWRVVPTSYFEYEDHPGSVYPDIDYTWYDDQAGETMAVPGGPHYMHSAQEYMGNPWGPSGQFFHAEDMRTKSAKELHKREPVPDHLKKKNRVRFYGLPQ